MQAQLPQQQQDQPEGLHLPFVLPFTMAETPISSRMMPPAFGAFSDMQGQMPMMDPNLHPFFNMMLQHGQMPGMTMPPHPDLNMTPSWTATSSSIATPSSASSMNDSGLSGTSDENSPPRGGGNSEELGKVQARLTLNSNSRQFTVTTDEINRRINYPEFMNSSTVAALMRKAKTKDGGPQMRRELEQRGIQMSQGRKKSAQLSSFSALLEEEAHLMARELNEIAKKDFPHQQLAETVFQFAMGKNEDANQLASDAMATVRFMKRLAEASGSVQVPFATVRGSPYPHDHTPLYQQMSTFSSLTHGFGVVNHKTWIGVYEQLATMTAAFCTASQQMPPMPGL